jgi:uncharacterized protein DUF6088
MMQTVENKIVAKIYGHGRGWAFSKVDFAASFDVANIHKALASLATAGRIRRVLRGIYDYPRFSEALGGTLSPDMDQVAQALARKFSWRIQPTGAAALNLMGLSTQVPGRWVYLSDGPARAYKMGKQELEFRRGSLREAGFKLRESGLLVQAIRALGKERIDARSIAAMKVAVKGKDRSLILRETKAVPEWIRSVIKLVCVDCNG